jgi:hypothetical protein
MGVYEFERERNLEKQVERIRASKAKELSREKHMKPYNWKKEQARLWATLFPADGQAETLQGELIRIAGKLTDQAFRNGNMNWDADHEKMWRFVGSHLL